jgi:hypothetical protein
MAILVKYMFLRHLWPLYYGVRSVDGVFKLQAPDFRLITCLGTLCFVLN